MAWLISVTVGDAAAAAAVVAGSAALVIDSTAVAAATSVPASMPCIAAGVDDIAATITTHSDD